MKEYYADYFKRPCNVILRGAFLCHIDQIIRESMRPEDDTFDIGFRILKNEKNNS